MGEDVRGEAARLRHRLEVARGRLDAVLEHGGGDGRGAAPADAGAGVGVARIDDDDEVRSLLRPAADRIACLLELAGALADGTLSEMSAGESARAVADAQPFRRPR